MFRSDNAHTVQQCPERLQASHTARSSADMTRNEKRREEKRREETESRGRRTEEKKEGEGEEGEDMRRQLGQNPETPSGEE